MGYGLVASIHTATIVYLIIPNARETQSTAPALLQDAFEISKYTEAALR